MSKHHRASSRWVKVLLGASVMVIFGSVVTVLAQENIVPDTADDRMPVDSFVKVDSMPKAINQVQPVYPESEKRAGVQGKIWVKMLVNKQGLVRNAVVLKREGASIPLEQAAVEACRQWRFTPATVGGKPVAVWVTTSVVFTLAPKTE